MSGGLAALPLRPSSPRARHQPELATERPNNGAITNPCCAVIRPLRRHRSSTGNEPRSPRPPHSPIGVRAGRQVSAVRASGLIVEGTRRRRRASNTVRSGRSGKINSAGTNAQRGRPESGQLSGTRPRVQPRLARCPPRALTRWCVARGEGAARCAGRPCRSVGRHAASPGRAAPDTPRADRRPRAVPAR